MITERLFNAGSSSFEDEIKKPTAQDAVKTIPTVGTAESYGDEPVQESAERAANKELIQKIDDSGIKAGRGRRRLNMSFLKAGKRK